MDWKAKASSVFAAENDGKRWYELYRSNPVSFEEYMFQRRRDHAVSLVAEEAEVDSAIIDVGCGAAPVMSRLASLNLDCVGLDFSFDMLKFSQNVLSRQNRKDQPLLQADCQQLPIADHQFDVVVCLGVISYVEDYQPVLKELYRIMKPGGLLILSFRNRYNPILLDPVVATKQLVKLLIGRNDNEATVGRFLNYREVNNDLKAVGFQRQEHFGTGVGPLRFNRKQFLSDRSSIALSRFLESAFAKLRLGFLSKWLADVSLWTYRKPG